MNFDLSMRPRVKEYRDEAVRILERKMDGHRITLVRENDFHFYGRKEDSDVHEKIVETQEHLVQFALKLPRLTVVEMEIFAEHSTDVPAYLKDGRPLNFGVFAVPYFDGRPLMHLPFEEYFEAQTLHDPRVRFDSPTQLDADALRREAKRLKVEGWVVKAEVYDQWFKIKPIRSVDAIMVGWHSGNGRNLGRLGAIEVALADGRRLGKVSGFSDEQRDQISRRDIGRVVEVEFDSLTSGGKLRFAQFLRFRDDKSALECDGREL